MKLGLTLGRVRTKWAEKKQSKKADQWVKKSRAKIKLFLKITYLMYQY